MELKDTSKEGIGKFALDLIKKYGKEVVLSLISALVKLAWEKDPKEDEGATTQGEQRDAHGCIIGREVWNGTKCVPDVG